MSHFTKIKTHFHNVFYLKKALTKLNIVYKWNKKKNLVIPQSNGYDLIFDWNGKEYELMVDISFWEQLCPLESFLDKIAQEYAGEVIVGESKKIGFQPIKYYKNTDNSNTLILERWNNTKK